MTLRESIIARTAELGLSRAELARRSHVPRSALTKFLNSRSNLDTRNLDRLMMALNMRTVSPLNAMELHDQVKRAIMGADVVPCVGTNAAIGLAWAVICGVPLLTEVVE